MPSIAGRAAPSTLERGRGSSVSAIARWHTAAASSRPCTMAGTGTPEPTVAISACDKKWTMHVSRVQPCALKSHEPRPALEQWAHWAVIEFHSRQWSTAGVASGARQGSPMQHDHGEPVMSHHTTPTSRSRLVQADSSRPAAAVLLGVFSASTSRISSQVSVVVSSSRAVPPGASPLLLTAARL